MQTTARQLRVAATALSDPVAATARDLQLLGEHCGPEFGERAFDAEGRTSIAIAHRLATVRRADVIFVLDDGVICERRSHDALLASNGLYARLYRMQFRTGEAVDTSPLPEVASR